METKRSFTRPAFKDAVAAFQGLLAERKLPTEPLWVFDENLCFEQDPAREGGFRLGFQTQFTPPPPDAARLTYEYFLEFGDPLVFYRIGSSQGRSICLLLCDTWFEQKGERDGFVRREEWHIAFRPGTEGEVEEVRDRARWENRWLRGRPLHDLDFCMTLRAVHETLAHGRVLSSYERSALKVLHLWRRVFRANIQHD